ncbi:alanine--tRNA ligase [bacterium]|nr:alanine--tRNA ligase [bacterium]
MNSAQIRTQFLEYFARHGHTVVDSSPVVPRNDPTLLFANAGMNQFKNVFIGLDKRPYTRATSCQECIRAGGKHNDLDNVGKTPRHHTFFEMLGNFSFGDYFKEDAIAFAWELLTKVYGLSPDHLFATVYEEDDEAERLWKKHVAASRIVRLGKKDNFWEMGDVGPCGPCSEIHLHLGAFFGAVKPDQAAFDESECLELWNLVFMQFNRREDGSLDKLPKPSVDTGAGLERVTCALNGQYANYASDLFAPLIGCVVELSGVKYVPLTYPRLHPQTPEQIEAGMPHRVIADHIRAVSFALADGAVFSNEGRGYVLRRILRRAVRYGRRIGIQKPFLADLVDVLDKSLGHQYPALRERKNHVEMLITVEEERFEETLSKGIDLFRDLAARSDAARRQVSGADAFKLYDTYGFPIDITQDMAREMGWTVDEPGFQAALEEQRARAKAARNVAGVTLDKVYEDLYKELGDTTFVGYRSLEAPATIRAIINDNGERCTMLGPGSNGWLVFDQTPFYGESGGQEGDRGEFQISDSRLQIGDVVRPAHNLFAHRVSVNKGTVAVGDKGTLVVDRASREATMRHHTATHLLHAALHKVLGKHATQAGSSVGPERLRFDFRHHTALSAEQKLQIERIVNEWICRDTPVSIVETTIEDAQKAGAMMLFDEKYGEHVRMIRIDDVSSELCGGTHSPTTGFIGPFCITGESAIAAGVRRIEALCGMPAVHEIQRQRALLHDAASILSASTDELAARIQKLIDENKQLTKKLKEARTGGAGNVVDATLKSAKQVNGATLIVANLGELETDELRAVSDQLRAKLTSYVIVLGAVSADKCTFIAQVSDDQVKAGRHAGNIVKEIARIAGGGGGGKPNSAQAGGKDPSKLDEALDAVEKLVK